jgi:hypothetical protein
MEVLETNGSGATNGKRAPARKRPVVAKELTRPVACLQCGTALEQAWEFCGACGAPVSVPTAEAPKPVLRRSKVVATTSTTVVDPVVPTVALPAETVEAVAPVIEVAETSPGTSSTSARRLSIRQRWPWAVGVVAAVAILALLVTNDLGTHSTLSRTKTNLASTRASLSSTRASLASTKTQLSDTQSQLAQRTTERDSLQSKLNATQTELTGVQGSLSQAQDRISLQAGQITTVKTCLSGIATTLDDDLNGDFSGGLSALEAVQPACQAAQNIVGG